MSVSKSISRRRGKLSLKGGRGRCRNYKGGAPKLKDAVNKQIEQNKKVRMDDATEKVAERRETKAAAAAKAAKESADSAAKDKKELLEKRRLIEARKEREATAAEIKELEAQGMNKGQARASALQRRAQQKMIKAKEATRDFMDKKDLGAKNILMDFIVPCVPLIVFFVINFRRSDDVLAVHELEIGTLRDVSGVPGSEASDDDAAAPGTSPSPGQPSSNEEEDIWQQTQGIINDALSWRRLKKLTLRENMVMVLIGLFMFWRAFVGGWGPWPWSFGVYATFWGVTSDEFSPGKWLWGALGIIKIIFGLANIISGSAVPSECYMYLQNGGGEVWAERTCKNLRCGWCPIDKDYQEGQDDNKGNCTRSNIDWEPDTDSDDEDDRGRDSLR